MRTNYSGLTTHVVGNNLFLGFWTNLSIKGFREGDYMAVYAALGVAQAIFSFFTSFSLAYVYHYFRIANHADGALPYSVVALYSGLRIFKAALSGVLRSPISFFDTTPMGEFSYL